MAGTRGRTSTAPHSTTFTFARAAALAAFFVLSCVAGAMSAWPHEATAAQTPQISSSGFVGDANAEPGESFVISLAVSDAWGQYQFFIETTVTDAAGRTFHPQCGGEQQLSKNWVEPARYHLPRRLPGSAAAGRATISLKLFEHDGCHGAVFDSQSLPFEVLRPDLSSTTPNGVQIAAISTPDPKPAQTARPAQSERPTNALQQYAATVNAQPIVDASSSLQGSQHSSKRESQGVISSSVTPHTGYEEGFSEPDPQPIHTARPAQSGRPTNALQRYADATQSGSVSAGQAAAARGKDADRDEKIELATRRHEQVAFVFPVSDEARNMWTSLKKVERAGEKVSASIGDAIDDAIDDIVDGVEDVANALVLDDYRCLSDESLSLRRRLYCGSPGPTIITDTIPDSTEDVANAALNDLRCSADKSLSLRRRLYCAAPRPTIITDTIPDSTEDVANAALNDLRCSADKSLSLRRRLYCAALRPNLTKAVADPLVLDDVDCVFDGGRGAAARAFCGFSVISLGAGKVAKLAKADDLVGGGKRLVSKLDEVEKVMPGVKKLEKGLDSGHERLEELLDSARKSCATGARKCFGNKNELKTLLHLQDQGCKVKSLHSDQTKEFKLDGKRASPDGIVECAQGAKRFFKSLTSWVESRPDGNLGYDWLTKKANHAREYGMSCVILVVHARQDGTGSYTDKRAADMAKHLAAHGVGLEAWDYTGSVSVKRHSC